MGVGEQLGWLAPAASPFVPFTFHPISEPKHPTAHRYAHGLGVGDIDGDGRADVVSTKGYWLAPETPGDTPWPFTAADLGPDAAHMAIYDVNGDGLADIVASAAHQVGVWWFEQKQASRHAHVRETRDRRVLLAVARPRRGRHRQRRHRRRGHRQASLGAWPHRRPATQCARRPLLVPAAPIRDTVSWTKHLIDDTSGVGNQVVLGDVDGDGRLDVASANKHGVFVFLQR